MGRHISSEVIEKSYDESTDSLLTPDAQAMLEAVESYLAEHPEHFNSIALPLTDRRTYSTQKA
ncbi:hypothetical protein HDF16_001603 [Granulicella aggregans]|uniref:Uncharacterized protein n=1 Tax=Granulicella aggregans TaxID=474949 RepID=A0A7W7ZBR6_9BACT|nr:hypothetical protein [Granulicella aggregans]MBB5056918.1 hypothetical protein [Granulicella aggregans]